MGRYDPGNKELHETAERLIDREVHLCVSSVVERLLETDRDGADSLTDDYYDALSDVTVPCGECDTCKARVWFETSPDANKAGDPCPRHTAESEVTLGYCTECERLASIDPYGSCTKHPAVTYCDVVEVPECEDMQQPEVYEWWAVSSWLAHRLKDQGEVILKDCYGMIVWGRTCSGQSMILDGIFQDIAEDILR